MMSIARKNHYIRKTTVYLLPPLQLLRKTSNVTHGYSSVEFSKIMIFFGTFSKLRSSKIYLAKDFEKITLIKNHDVSIKH